MIEETKTEQTKAPPEETPKAPVPPTEDARKPLAESPPVQDKSLLAGAQGESKPGEEGKGDKSNGKGAEPPKEGEKPPVTFKDFTIPEGVEVNKELLGQFTEAAAKVGLTQEQAQGLVTLHTKSLETALNNGYKAWDDLQAKWQDEIKNDPEIGGQQLNDNLAAAAKVIDEYGGNELREALNITGAGNNPAIVKAFIKLGQALSEGKFVPAKGTTIPRRGPAETLYPSKEAE